MHNLGVNNGWIQVNAQRFTLDFWPILILLVGLGTQRVAARVWKASILWGVGLNVLALIVMLLTPGFGGR